MTKTLDPESQRFTFLAGSIQHCTDILEIPAEASETTTTCNLRLS